MTSQELQNQLESGKVLVDFYADWCGPCKIMEPVVRKVSEKHDLDLLKVDVDDSRELAEEYSIRSIPTVILFDDGEEIGRAVGTYPAHRLSVELGLVDAD